MIKVRAHDYSYSNVGSNYGAGHFLFVALVFESLRIFYSPCALELITVLTMLFSRNTTSTIATTITTTTTDTTDFFVLVPLIKFDSKV